MTTQTVILEEIIGVAKCLLRHAEAQEDLPWDAGILAAVLEDIKTLAELGTKLGEANG